jgi:hypothetical protein
VPDTALRYIAEALTAAVSVAVAVPWVDPDSDDELLALGWLVAEGLLEPVGVEIGDGVAPLGVLPLLAVGCGDCQQHRC